MNTIRHTTNKEARNQPLAPFTILLASKDSPYAHHYEPSAFEDQLSILRTLGFTDRHAAANGVRELHDKKQGYVAATMPGAYRLPQSNDGTKVRTVGLTVEDPEAFANALRSGATPFNQPRMEAMGELIMAMAAPLTEEEKEQHHQAINQRLDAYTYTGEAE